MSSVAFDKIVPFGQDFVIDDILLTLTLKERAAFFLCLIVYSIIIYIFALVNNIKEVE